MPPHRRLASGTGGGTGLLGRALTLAAATVLLVAVLAISAVAFVAAILGGLLLFAYFWWRMRGVRRRMRPRDEPASVVIEGEFVREDEPQGGGRRP